MGLVVDNPEDFATALDDWYDTHVEAAVVAAHKEVVLEAFSILTGIAPRWSGRYVGSINVMIGTIDGFALPPHPRTTGRHAIRWPDPVPGPYEAKDIMDIGAALATLGPYQCVYLSEAVPYAQKIEEGYSSQAPAGVFGYGRAILAAEFGPGYAWRFDLSVGSLF